MSSDEPVPPPPKRATRVNDGDQPNAEIDPDAAELDRSHRLAASSKILLRMAAKKGAKGRASDASGHNFVVDRNVAQLDAHTRETAKYGETINGEELQCTSKSSSHFRMFNPFLTTPLDCHHNERLEHSMKKMEHHMSKVEEEIAELRADFQGLRTLLLERLPLAPAAPTLTARAWSPASTVSPGVDRSSLSSSRPPPRHRAREGALPPTTRKRKRDEEHQQSREVRIEKQKSSSRVEKEKERAARRAEEERAKGAKDAKSSKQTQLVQQAVADKTRQKNRPSQPLTSVPVFDPNQCPRFDKFSLSQQILALASPNTTPETPDAPHLKISLDNLPYAMFLLISESLPAHSRTSLADLRVLWSGSSTARRVGEWAPVKMPYLHAAMNFSLVGPYLTTPRVGHRNFEMNDHRWPNEIQVPKLTASIMAVSVGLMKDPMSRTGAFIRDAFTICDQQSAETPQNWRRWLDKKTYDPSMLPNSWRSPFENLCGIPFVAFLKDVKSGEARRRRYSYA